MADAPPHLHRSFARAMRHQMTVAEWDLWEALRDRRLGGFKFRRQVPLKGYILDFVCFEARLIVEVDGAQHADSAYDAQRDAVMAGEGFLTLRFWNDEVMQNGDGVFRAILEALGARAGR
jgi:very-short-patch-repair endonuclease